MCPGVSFRYILLNTKLTKADGNVISMQVYKVYLFKLDK